MQPPIAPIKVVIFSSTEGLRYASAIQANLDRNPDLSGRIDVATWKQGTFDAGDHVLQSLLEIHGTIDFAVVLLTPDDDLKSKGVEYKSARDNILFEIGLMLGTLGKKRTLIVVEDSSTPKIKWPSDLSGINRLEFKQVSGQTPTATTGSISFEIAQRILTEGKRINPDGYPRTLRRLRDNWKKLEETDHDFLVHTLVGIDATAKREEFDEFTNLEQIYFLWAHAGNESWIRAAVKDDGDRERQRLRFTFCNQGNAHPSNVAIRISGASLTATSNGRPFTKLEFKARVPDAYRALLPVDARDHVVAQVGLNVRVRDALGTYWRYVVRPESPDYKVFKVPVVASEDDWPKAFEIQLGDHNLWSKFRDDGNHRYANEKPDFSQILAVVVELGGYDTGCTRVGRGAGVIELKDFIPSVAPETNQ